MNVPVWPLPPDSVPAEPQDTPWSMVCPSCKCGLMIRPGDNTSLKKHNRGIQCRRDTEIFEMNERGLYQASYGWFAQDILQPFLVHGTLSGFYLPAPIASYVRWNAGSGCRKYGYHVDTHVRSELTKFLTLAPEMQIAYLCGVILTAEYSREDREPVDYGADTDMPF